MTKSAIILSCVVLLSGFFQSNFAVAKDRVALPQLAELAHQAVLENYYRGKPMSLVLVGIDVDTKAKSFDQTYLTFQYLDRNTLRSDEYSKFLYTTYWVYFDFSSGKIVDIGPSTWGSYQAVEDADYYPLKR